MASDLHISEALTRNRAEVNQLIFGSPEEGWGLRPFPLSRVIHFRETRFGYASVETFLSTHPSEATGSTMDIAAHLSVMLLPVPDLEPEHGVVTTVTYDDMLDVDTSQVDLTEWAQGRVPDSWGALLVPGSFQVYRGTHFEEVGTDEARHLGGGKFGTDAEIGDVARLAAQTIDVTAEAVRLIGYEALIGQYAKSHGE